MKRLFATLRSTPRPFVRTWPKSLLCAQPTSCQRRAEHTYSAYARYQSIDLESLTKHYDVLRQSIYEGHVLGPQMDPSDVFVTNELSLSEINVFGFDYDYTLASYTEHLQSLIYDLALQHLVKEKKYPTESLNLPYDPDFAIRGLHFDVKKGLLMKIDTFQNIQMGTVYHGRTPLSSEQIKSLYNGVHISLDYMNKTMRQLIDLFSTPQACLLANLIQYFNDSQMDFDSEYLCYDVEEAIAQVHSSRLLHQHVMKDLEKYIVPVPNLRLLLERLHQSGKKLFILTNSPYAFVNAGMNLVVGNGWQSLFDVVIVEAHKPKFYTSDRPFRQVDLDKGQTSWRPVSGFDRGCVYSEGSIRDFSAFTSWTGSQVLYIGDHVYSDLLDPSVKMGWRTGAIIRELEAEISILNSPSHHRNLTWLLNLQRYIKRLQGLSADSQATKKLTEIQIEKNQISHRLKVMFNNHFGSVFRTFHNPTYFAHRMSRYAEIYTSSVENLVKYPLNHTFYPARVFLPHEPAPRRDEDGNHRCGP